MTKLIINNFPILMAQKRLKISEVSRDTGLSRTTLTKLYNAKEARVSIQTLEILCSYFDCEVSDILSTSNIEAS